MTSAEDEQRVEFLERQFTGIDHRFDEVNRQITELRHDGLGHFDEIYRRRERLEQEYHAITQALRRVEAGLAGGRGRREVLERDLAALKRHAAALQSRIEEIAQRLGRQRARPPRARSREAPPDPHLRSREKAVPIRKSFPTGLRRLLHLSSEHQHSGGRTGA